jgi:hypothetical protein
MAPGVFRSIHRRAKNWQVSMLPRTFTAKGLSHSSTVISRTGQFGKMPWALTRTSTGPAAASASLIIRSTSDASETSPWTPK